MRNLRYGMKTLVNRLKPTELNRYRTNLAERRFGMNCGDQLDKKNRHRANDGCVRDRVTGYHFGVIFRISIREEFHENYRRCQTRA